MEPGTLITAENVHEVHVGDIIAFVEDTQGGLGHLYRPSEELTVTAHDGVMGFEIKTDTIEYDAWFLGAPDNPNFRFVRRGDPARANSLLAALKALRAATFHDDNVLRAAGLSEAREMADRAIAEAEGIPY